MIQWQRLGLLGFSTPMDLAWILMMGVLSAISLPKQSGNFVRALPLSLINIVLSFSFYFPPNLLHFQWELSVNVPYWGWISWHIFHMQFLNVLFFVQWWALDCSSTWNPDKEFLLCLWHGMQDLAIWRLFYIMDGLVNFWVSFGIWLYIILTLNSLFPMLKVDGLIRLMGGEHTGPINIGNPGSYTKSAIHLH